MKQGFKLNTINRLIAIVSYLVSVNAPKKLTGIAKQMGLSKASTFRILSALEKARWVVREPDTERYRIGYEIMGLGLSILSNAIIKDVSMPYLTELRNITGETVGLTIRVGKERILIEELQSNHALRYIGPLGKSLPLLPGAVGKAILANMKQDEVAVVLDELAQSEVQRLASGQVLDVNRLRRELAKIRRQGFAVSREERYQGLSAVGAPIFNRHDEIEGAISICGPCERLQEDVLKKYCKLVRDAAKDITKQMRGTIKIPKISKLS